ncbi:MAG: NADH:flavin oxidoreductase [Promethearchaeota archaeon]|jgi:2,4-dienoyl-CoA reductase-like NADH-dependent reductase (Old Yellow Enzyme family)
MFAKPKKIGNLEIKNRFVRSATYEGMATEDGEITDRLIDLYKALSEGGCGLIITSLAYIQENGRGNVKQIGINKNDFILGLKKLAKIVHEHGEGCKVALQIAHAGRQSFHVKETIAPSAVLEKFSNKMPREMTTDEIEETIEAFSQAARRAKEAGFDAVQLHGAHGYLISEFLSPYTNRRTDQYGGNTDKRLRFVDQIYGRSRELVGDDFPILIKMNCDDFLEGGITLKESKKIAKILTNIGFDAIEISSCMWDTVKRKKEEIGWKPSFIPESRMAIGTVNDPAYHLPYAKEIKKGIDIPLILVGGINSINLVEEILNNGDADFVSFSRPLIREPDLPNRWINGIGSKTAECDYCNSCLPTLFAGGLTCPKIGKSYNF